MRFLVDECLSPALATSLRQAGHDAAHIVDLGMCGAPDTVVMQVARVQRRVLLSADTDFGELLARSNDDGPESGFGGFPSGSTPISRPLG